MSPVTENRRRTTDVQTAHLEGRMDMIEQRLETMDKKIDGVVSNIHEVLREIKSTSDRMQRMEIEATERSGEMKLLEQRFEDYLRRPQTTTTTTTSSPSTQPEDDLVRYRRRAMDVLVIAICILGIFGIALYITNNMLNKPAATVAGKILEHAP
jgi:hypothetical protein